MKSINNLLGTKYPLIQGGMANIATAQLASAVCNAGAMGLIGAGGNDVNWVKTEIDKMRKLTDKPFGVNIMLMSPHAKDIAELVIKERIYLVTTGAGSPAKYVPAWKEAGIIVIPVVANVRQAKKMEAIGVDAVVVEGTEAGGHIGEVTTMNLVPMVSDAVSIPVIAAGGIGDYRGVLATFVLGAQGVQVGTVLLATDECPIHDNYKQFVVNSLESDTIVTGREAGTPVRVLKNKMAIRYLELSQTCGSREELEHMTLGSLRKAVVDGNIDEGSFMAGQIAGMVKAVKPVKDVIEGMFEPINAYLNALCESR